MVTCQVASTLWCDGIQLFISVGGLISSLPIIKRA